jgi:hypothetical protein
VPSTRAKPSTRTNGKRRPTSRASSVRRRRQRMGAWVALAGVMALASAVAISATAGSSDPTAPEDAAPVSTGELSSMGLPVVETPGFASGRSEAGGVEATAANWAMGRVPLDIAVKPAWVLRNSGDTAVDLGDPYPEIREGCCPGPFEWLGPRTLEPGASTTLSFELSMHEGMDGWHDIAVHVPVLGSGDGPRVLTLEVTGDFR